MNEIQQVILNGRKYIIIPEEEYFKLFQSEEDKADLAAIAQYDKEKPETFPASVINKILLDEQHPLKVFREYRGFTQSALAGKCGINASTIAQIETGKRNGTTKTLGKIAKELGLTIDDITL